MRGEVWMGGWVSGELSIGCGESLVISDFWMEVCVSC